MWLNVLTCQRTVREVFDFETDYFETSTKTLKYIVFGKNHVPAAVCLQVNMQWRSHVTGLAFSFVFVASYFTNKVRKPGN